MRTILVAALIMASVGGCSSRAEPPGEMDGLRRALVSLVREKDAGEQIRLSDAWPGVWDRAAILGPYSSDASASELLGFEFAYEAASPWTNTEGGVVVVLTNGGEGRRVDQSPVLGHRLVLRAGIG